MNNIYKKTSYSEWSIEDLILATINQEKRRSEVNSWFSYSMWKALFEILEREKMNMPNQDKQRFISWFIDILSTSCDGYSLYQLMFRKIRNADGAPGMALLQGEKYVPNCDEISLIFPKALLYDHIKRNLTTFFPLQAMEVKDRFVLYNLKELKTDFAFNIHDLSFYYHSAPLEHNMNNFNAQCLSDLGGEILNHFIQGARFKNDQSDLVILTFDRSLLMENGVHFFRPTWVDKILVREADGKKYERLEGYLESYGFQMGVAKSIDFNLDALIGVELLKNKLIATDGKSLPL